MSFPIQYDLSGFAGIHNVEAFLEVIDRKMVRNNRSKIEPALEHGFHFIPCVKYFTAIYPFDNETLKNDMWRACDILRRDNNVGCVLQYTEHIAWLLFLKFLGPKKLPY